MTQKELENQLGSIVCTHTGIKPNTDLYYKLSDNIGYLAEDDIGKRFIVLKQSFKLKNIKFDMKGFVSCLTENALTVGMTYDSMDVYKAVLLVLLNIINICVEMIVNLDEDMVAIVRYLHKNNAYKLGISKEQIKKDIQLKRDIDEVLSDLVKCKSIAVNDDTICLKEKVIVRIKKEKQSKKTKVKKNVKT